MDFHSKKRPKSGHIMLPQRSELANVLCEYFSEMFIIVLTFLAARNSLMWFLEATMVWDKDFWQTQWEQFVDRNYSPVLFYVGGVQAIILSVYYIWGGFYSLLDVTGCLSQYKVQPGTNQPLKNTALRKVAFQTINLLILIL